MQVHLPPIFNPSGDDSPQKRRLFGGNPTNIINLKDVKYKWASHLFTEMRANIWIPQATDLTPDINNYVTMPPNMRRAFDGMLSYLTFLDSLQTCVLPLLMPVITAPEVRICMGEQLSQEQVHSQSYAYIIETVIPTDKRDYIYELWREDPVLLRRCEYIQNLYDRYIHEMTMENYTISIVSDFLLEGIYFFPGFRLFYAIANERYMSATADIIKLIERDEQTHLKLIANIIRTGLAEGTLVWNTDEIMDLFRKAAEYEIEWGLHIGLGVNGINATTIEQYAKYLCNIRARAIGLPTVFEGRQYSRNPYAHLDRFAATTGEDSITRDNFFESGVIYRNPAKVVDGWDSI